LDRNLASRIGESTITWMSFATTLREFPLGLVSLAVSTATLPKLSTQATLERETVGMCEEHRAAFGTTLVGALRLVLFLTLPAAVGLIVLARPLVALFFQHGLFGSEDTIQTARALRFYVIGMLFAAVDLPLVFAFYARQDTVRPAIVGILGVGLYVAAALPTYRTLGMVGLVLANDVQLAGHSMLMLWLYRRRVGRLGGAGIGSLLLKSVLGSTLMGGAMHGVMQLLTMLPYDGKLSWAVTVLCSVLVGMTVYLGICALARVREVQALRMLFKRLWPGQLSR
jgi:putative peptidoglycan lipid II flippase